LLVHEKGGPLAMPAWQLASAPARTKTGGKGAIFPSVSKMFGQISDCALPASKKGLEKNVARRALARRVLLPLSL